MQLFCITRRFIRRSIADTYLAESVNRAFLLFKHSAVAVFEDFLPVRLAEPSSASAGASPLAGAVLGWGVPCHAFYIEVFSIAQQISEGAHA
jgi:hypothetical protein